jgi:ketosteroid isomerase-like protein
VSTEGLETVRRFSRALGDRDLTKVASLLHRDLVVHTAGGLPYSGDYYGPQGFLELFAAMTRVMDLAPGPLCQQSLDEQTVVSRFRLRFVARSSGKQAEMDLVEIYQVSDGLIVDLDVYYKDSSAVAAVLA